MNFFLEERTNGLPVGLAHPPPVGLALYIDGDLQFDTRDEALYHELLAIPALCLVRRRKGQTAPIRVLICGGGDGLALREALRFPNVESVDLVDYSAEVVEMGRSRLAELNQSAFDDPRAATHIADAWDFIAGQVARGILYDAVICDFTVPRRPGNSRVYSQEWYSLVRRALAPGGLAAVNSLSPTQAPEAFWCLQRTIKTSGLHPVPFRACLPTFHEHGYGVWSFTLCGAGLRQADLHDLESPVDLRQANLSTIGRAARFSLRERSLAAAVGVNTVDDDRLLPLLLNPGIQRMIGAARAGSNRAETSSAGEPPFDLDPLIRAIPVLHPYHTREMVETMARHVVGTIRLLDIRRLVAALLKRASELPRRLRTELARLHRFLRESGEAIRLENWIGWSYRLFAILLVIITIANSISPDSAFAKGFGGVGHSSVSHGTFAPGPMRISSSGFRTGYGGPRMTDIEGHTFARPVYRYYPTGVHVHVWNSYGGYNAQPVTMAPATPQDQHAGMFMADSDLIVLDNGDLVVQLSKKAYILVSKGQFTLMSTDSPAHVLPLHPDPGVCASIRNDLSYQQTVVANEIDARRDWLTWVGWTQSIVPAVKDDETEFANLQDLSRRLGEAQAAVASLPSGPVTNALPPIGDVQLFGGAILDGEGRVSIRLADNSTLVTDGAHVWQADASSGSSSAISAPLRSIVASIILGRIAENNADVKNAQQDMSNLTTDRRSLQQDLSDYQAIYQQNGYDPNYEVDYGTDEIGVNDALARTRADLASNSQDMATTYAQQQRLEAELNTLRRAEDSYGGAG